jgi:hypothetical protein
LGVIVEHVLDLNLRIRDVQDLVTTIDDVTLSSDEDIVAIHQKDAFLLSGLVGEAEKFERNRRRRWRRRWPYRLRLHYKRRLFFRNECRRSLSLEDIPACTFVLGSFTVLQQVSPERWIEGRRCFGAPASLSACLGWRSSAWDGG